MKNIALSLLGCALLSATAAQLAAQPPTEPPKVLRIFREDIKEGKGVPHEKSEINFTQALVKAKYPANVIAMTTLTGTNQAWFLEGHDSFDSIGTAQAVLEAGDFGTLDAIDGELRASSRSWIAIYHPELSYHAQELVASLPKARFFNVVMIRVLSGHDADFAELGKMAIAATEKAMGDQPIATYQLVSGGPNGTYLLFEPAASLKALDGAAERGRAMFQAMGDSGAKRFLKVESESIATSDSLLFAINPRMSYVSKEFAAVDPDFWNPKPPEPKPAGKGAKSGTK